MFIVKIRTRDFDVPRFVRYFVFAKSFFLVFYLKIVVSIDFVVSVINFCLPHNKVNNEMLGGSVRVCQTCDKLKSTRV